MEAMTLEAITLLNMALHAASLELTHQQSWKYMEMAQENSKIPQFIIVVTIKI